jgi:hypothetical protein
MNFKDMMVRGYEHKSWGGMSDFEALGAIKMRPVCPRCERWAMRDRGWRDRSLAHCPYCGWRGKTICLKDYLKRKMYK